MADDDPQLIVFPAVVGSDAAREDDGADDTRELTGGGRCGMCAVKRYKGDSGWRLMWWGEERDWCYLGGDGWGLGERQVTVAVEGTLTWLLVGGRDSAFPPSAGEGRNGWLPTGVRWVEGVDPW